MNRGSVGGSVTISAVRAKTGFQEPEETVEKWRLWRARPDKIRTQFQVGMETVTAVFVGPQWWSLSPTAGFMTNGGDPSSSHGLGPAEVLVDTPQLLSFLKVRGVSRTTFLARSAYLVAVEPATPERHGPPAVLHALGPGADLYQLYVDAEVGVLLRSQAELGGKPFRVVEVSEMGLNEELDERLFTPGGLAES